jgi:large subunit ribosomal protein L31
VKPAIHPKYFDVEARCACGNTFKTRSTKPELHLEICNMCHPFFTGRQKLIDTEGRVERFTKRFGAQTTQSRKAQVTANKAAKATKSKKAVEVRFGVTALARSEIQSAGLAPFFDDSFRSNRPSRCAASCRARPSAAARAAFRRRRARRQIRARGARDGSRALPRRAAPAATCGPRWYAGSVVSTPCHASTPRHADFAPEQAREPRQRVRAHSRDTLAPPPSERAQSPVDLSRRARRAAEPICLTARGTPRAPPAPSTAPCDMTTAGDSRSWRLCSSTPSMRAGSPDPQEMESSARHSNPGTSLMR